MSRCTVRIQGHKFQRMGNMRYIGLAGPSLGVTDDAHVARVIAEKRRLAAHCADDRQSPTVVSQFGHVPTFDRRRRTDALFSMFAKMRFRKEYSQ